MAQIYSSSTMKQNKLMTCFVFVICLNLCALQCVSSAGPNDSAPSPDNEPSDNNGSPIDISSTTTATNSENNAQDSSANDFFNSQDGGGNPGDSTDNDPSPYETGGTNNGASQNADAGNVGTSYNAGGTNGCLSPYNVAMTMIYTATVVYSLMAER